MTTPVLNASPKTTPGEALGLMLKHHFRHLPVVDLKGRLKGVLSIRDLMHEQMEEIRRQHHSLEHYVSSEREGEPERETRGSNWPAIRHSWLGRFDASRGWFTGRERRRLFPVPRLRT